MIGSNPGGKPSWKQVKAHESELWGALHAASLEGQCKRARYLQRRYLMSYAARLVATRAAFRASNWKRRPPIAKLPEIAKQLNAWNGTDELVSIRWKRKAHSSHDFRPIMDFGIENRALQYLVDECIKAQLDLHPMQYAINGGRHAAVLRAREALVAGFDHVTEMDIQDCYLSFDGDKLSGLLPVPKEVTEKVVLSRSLNLYPDEMYAQSCDGPLGEDSIVGQYLAEARQGIAQGSAVSSVVAEVLLAPVMGNLPESGVAVSYADNILLMAKSEEKAVTMRKALRRLLAVHPAGPLRLNEPKIYRPGMAVEFLGYKLTVNGVECSIEPTQRNLQKFNSQFARRLKRIQATSVFDKNRPRLVADIKRYVMSWSNAFDLWPGAKQHMNRHFEMVKRIIAPSGS